MITSRPTFGVFHGMPVVSIRDEAHFQSCLAEAGTKLVVVDFSAKWYGSFQLNAPVYEHLSNKNPQILFLKVDVDNCEQVAAAYGVSATRTFMFFRLSLILDRIDGAANPEEVEAKILELASIEPIGQGDSSSSDFNLMNNERTKPEGKIKAYVDFTQFNKNYEDYLKRKEQK